MSSELSYTSQKRHAYIVYNTKHAMKNIHGVRQAEIRFARHARALRENLRRRRQQRIGRTVATKEQHAEEKEN